MNTHQRGVYQPAMDNIPIYDLSDEEIEEEEHSRLPLLIVIALLVLAAFAGVVWLAYNQGVARGRAGAAIVIDAPDGPVRTAPLGGGGAPAPYKGLKVYEQSLPPDQEAQSSTLAVPPQISSSPPALAPPRAPGAALSDAPPVRLNPDTPALTVRQPPSPTPAKPPVQAAVTAPAAPIAGPAPPPSATAAVSAVSGKAVLQIGAYESPEIANGAWTTFRSRHANVAARLTQDVQKADLGAKGTWYRLRVGPFADKAAANAACEKLRSEGGTCFVTAP
jgi:cell division septation protein DedD